MKTKQTEPIAYLQWLRVFAAIAVVVMHTGGKRWLSISHETTQWLILTFYDGLVRWPVPIFIMITGALFLPRKTELKAVMTRYIPRMLAALVFWSAVYTFYAWRHGTEEDLVLKFVSGHYHLWYLPFLCGLYLTLPFLQKLVTDQQLKRQLLAVSCVVGLLIPWLADVIVLIWPGSSQVVRTIEGDANISFFFDHIAILLLGHVLHQTDLTPGARKLLYAAGLLGVAVTGGATIWASYRTDFQNSVFCDFTAPNNLCAAAALFVFAKYHLRKLPKFLDEIAACSFGIYLVHVLVIDVLADFGCHVLAWDPVWAVPAVSAAVFLLSLAAAALLRRLPVVGRYLV